MRSPIARVTHIVATLAFLVSPVPNVFAATYHVYYLGGQSNMDGYGLVSELPEALDAPVEGVYIFHGASYADAVEPVPEAGRGIWAAVRSGHGAGFTSDGATNTYSDRFGVELSFARRMQALLPDRNIAIIKYSRGGTSIHARSHGNGCWSPAPGNAPGSDTAGEAPPAKEYNQYDHFLATLRHAFAARDIDGDGEDDTLIPAGIVWMQGESDGTSDVAAAAYLDNLTELMGLIRAALRVDDLPVVIGRISDSGRQPRAGDDGMIWDFGEQVRAAQAEFCERDPHAALVTVTDELDYSDPFHYDTAGFIILGEQFAEALAPLIEQTGP